METGHSTGHLMDSVKDNSRPQSCQGSTRTINEIAQFDIILPDRVHTVLDGVAFASVKGRMCDRMKDGCPTEI